MPWFYYVGRLIARLILLFAQYQIKGRENIPQEGPLLVVANHIATADPAVLAISINRKAIFMAKDQLFTSRWKAYFIRGFGSFPVNRKRLDTRVLRYADKILDEGLLLVMFPEGGRSADYRLMSARPGSAIIASRRDIPILPVGITGTEKIKGIRWMFRRPRVEVNIGQSFRLPPVKGRLDKARLAEYSALIMRRIAELLPPEYLGDEYAAREGG